MPILFPSAPSKDHSSTNSYISLFSSFNSKVDWHISIDEYQILTKEITILSNKLTHILANQPFFQSSIPKTALFKILRPLVGDVCYILFDRLFRIHKLFEFYGPDEIQLLPAKISQPILTKTHLYALARDSFLFNQYLINSFLPTSPKSTPPEDMANYLSNDRYSFHEWDFYSGYTPKSVSKQPSDRQSSVNKLHQIIRFIQQRIRLVLGIFRLYRFIIRQKLYKLKEKFHDYSNIILCNGITYNSRFLTNEHLTYPNHRLLFKSLIDVDRTIKKFKKNTHLRSQLNDNCKASFIESLTSSLDHLNAFNHSHSSALCTNFSNLFFDIFPISGIEACPKLYQTAYKEFNKLSPKAFMTSYPSSNENFWFINGVATSQNIPVYGVQHSARGGYFANDPIIAEENIGGTDFYITSGWTNKEPHLPLSNHGFVPLPSPSYSEMSKNKSTKINSNQKILLALGEIFTYPVKYDGTYYIDSRLNYLNHLETLLETINKYQYPVIIKSYCKLSYDILKPHLVSWDNKFSNVEIFHDLRKGKAKELFNSVTCTIWDVPAGGFVESLVMNVPTFSFSHHDLMRFQPDAKPYIDSLKSNQLLSDNCVDMAHAIHQFMSAPENWWKEKHRQQSIQSFLDRYIKIDDQWASEWSSFINAIGPMSIQK